MHGCKQGAGQLRTLAAAAPHSRGVIKGRLFCGTCLITAMCCVLRLWLQQTLLDCACTLELLRVG